ncbi:MAG: hypothetical protein Q7S39_03025 [Ignavibacteria bacterium]|nr:hypothetical protein [Ignavibacteria bacterium]
MKYFKYTTVYHNGKTFVVIIIPKDFIKKIDDIRKQRLLLLLSDNCRKNHIEGKPIVVWLDVKNEMQNFDNDNNSHSFISEKYDYKELEAQAKKSKDSIRFDPTLLWI